MTKREPRYITIIPFIDAHLPEWIPKTGRVLLVRDGVAQEDIDFSEDIKAGIRDGRVMVHNQMENLGYTRTINEAMKRVYLRGFDFALIWNSDAKLVHPVENLVNRALTLGAGIMAPARCIQPTDKNAETYWACPKCDHVDQNISHADEKATYCWSPTEQGPIGTVDKVGVVYALSGAQYSPIFLASTKMWMGIGGFDEMFSPGFYEDCDLHIKARKLGWRTFTDGEVLYFHGDEKGGSKSFKKVFTADEMEAHSARCVTALFAKWGYSNYLGYPLVPSDIDPLGIRRGLSERLATPPGIRRGLSERLATPQAVEPE